MLTVLALDPGSTTGWAYYRQGKLIEQHYEHYKQGQMGPEPHHLKLNNFLEMCNTSEFVLVCERFEYRNTSRPGLVLDSREYIGVVKLFAEQHDISLHMQNASEAKGFVKDIHLKRLNLYHSGFKHAMDATRHLLYYLVNHHHDKDLTSSILQKGWLPVDAPEAR